MHWWEGPSIPDARKGGTRHPDERRPGRDRRVQRRHEREKTMKKRRKWNSISSRANTFGAVCYVTSLLGERGGLLKRLRCHLVCRSLGNRGDKGALSNPRKIRELSRGSPFSAPSSSHYHPTDNKRGAEIKRYTRSSSILVHSNPA